MARRRPLIVWRKRGPSPSGGDDWDNAPIGEPPPGVHPVDPDPGDTIIIEPNPGGGKKVTETATTAGHRFYDLGGVSAKNIELEVDCASSENIGHQFGIYLRRSGSNRNNTSCYLFRNNGSKMELVRLASGSVFLLDEFEAGITADTRYKLHMQTYEGQRARFWLSVNERPLPWAFDLDDPNITTKGRIGWYSHSNQGARSLFSWRYALLPQPGLEPPPLLDTAIPQVFITSGDALSTEYTLEGYVEHEVPLMALWVTVDGGDPISLFEGVDALTYEGDLLTYEGDVLTYGGSA